MGKLWYGGKIYTLTEPNATVEAIYTENGSIVEIGNKVSLERRYKNKIEASYNLIGDTMYPGFVDSHLHIIGHGGKAYSFRSITNDFRQSSFRSCKK
ncbi:hypothetical protein [Gracilibacillus sp. JCM 18860]|uniref:hypothetical protein n=1 Tax=Gracilibacillus sp. JCM 18860 TaxID=1306159 RepID=UPI000A7B8A94